MKKQHNNQAGFTIIELMIALAIMATLLTLSSFLLVQIGKLYSKGVNASTAQNASRSIIAEISNTLQFSGEEPAECFPARPSGPPPYTSDVTCAVKSVAKSGKTVHSYCIGTTRYSYIINSKQADSPTGDESAHVLWQDKMTGPGDCYPVDITVNNPTGCLSPTPPVSSTDCALGKGKELAPKSARLTRFSIDKLLTGTYGIDVWLAYGDTDLLNITLANNASVDCTAGRGGNAACAGYATCKGGPGQEYCATSSLSTTITRRL